ncbi:MAG TPA: hypothetical protein VGC17_06280 [Lactovum miscens]|uniref:hypothetical protein n=1 Tax=Lactovum miscens TaxID=190387 RepID=UPI002ED9CBDA
MQKRSFTQSFKPYVSIVGYSLSLHCPDYGKVVSLNLHILTRPALLAVVEILCKEALMTVIAELLEVSIHTTV